MMSKRIASAIQIYQPRVDTRVEAGKYIRMPRITASSVI